MFLSTIERKIREQGLTLTVWYNPEISETPWTARVENDDAHSAGSGKSMKAAIEVAVRGLNAPYIEGFPEYRPVRKKHRG